MTRKQALRQARQIVLDARNAGGTGLQGVWEYLRNELDGECDMERARR